MLVYQRVGGKHPMILFGLKTHPRMVVQDFATIHCSSQLMDEYVMICTSWHYLIHFDEWLNQFDRTSLMHSEIFWVWTVLNHFDRFWSCNKALFTGVFIQHLDLADQNKVEQLPLGPFGPFGCWRVDHRFWTHFKRGSQNGNGWVSTSKHVLIGALEHFLFSIIDGIILPVD